MTEADAGRAPRRAANVDSGFEARFRQLFRDGFAVLFRYLDRLSGDAALADDLAQEAFARLYARGAMPADPRAWLVSVASNLFRDERRRARRRRLVLVRRSPDAVLGDAPAAPDARVDADERRRAVRAALDGLPDRDRRLLLLSAGGFSYREISGTLGIAEASVGALLARARHAFRAAFERRGGAPE